VYIHLISSSDNPIGESGAKALGEALEINKHLRSLNVCETGAGDLGVKYYSDALTVNAILISLNLSGRSVVDSF
jgi:hypothetical protein